MRRGAAACGILMMMAAALSARQAGGSGPQDNRWTLTEGAAAGRKTLTATTRARVSGPSSPVYELTLTCAGGGPETALALFDSAGTPRPITQWHERLVEGSVMAGTVDQTLYWLEVSYAVDGGQARTATVERMEEFEPSEVPSILKVDLLGASSAPPAGLPRTSMLVSGLFPNERVEFSFAALTPDQRSAIQSSCFPGSPR